MEQKLCDIVNYHGVNNQIVVWIEEMSELTKELCKYQRKKHNIFDIKGEINDVQICLDQMKLVFKYTAQEQKQDYDYKVNRELGRIGKNE